MSPPSNWQYLVLVSLSLSCSFLHVKVLSQREGDLRLSGYGASRLAGRLEIFISGEWGRLCAPRDPLDVAKVACRQLGLGHFIADVLGQGASLRYGLGSGPVWLEDVSCHANDLHLLRCTHNRAEVNSSCEHHLDFSVMCSGVLTPYEGEVRLVGGAYASEGVVEINLHHSWARICSTDMELGLAGTICRQLGYTSAVSVQKVENVTGSSFWLTPPSICHAHSDPCVKSCLPDLLSSAVFSNSCSSYDELHTWNVVCRMEESESEFGNATSGSTAACARQSSETEELEIRFHGNDPEQGRVEVFVGGQWTTLQKPTNEGATVVCKQLGFPTFLTSKALSELTWSLDLPPLGSQVIISCRTGLETHISSCELTSASVQNPDDDAYIHCSPILWPFGSLKLIGGAGPFGQLLVSPGITFMWLCDAHFSMREASVACRQMGYSNAIRIVRNSLLSDYSAASLLSYSLNCSGEEEYLMACQRRSVASEVCRENLDMVAVQCGSSSSTGGWKVRLVSVADDDGIHNDSNHGNGSEGVRVGRVEVLLEEGGSWGTVCEEGFSNLSAHVICRQLGFETFGNVYPLLAYPDETGPVHLSSVQCTGFEDLLDYCPHSLSTGNCSHIITIDCSDILPYSDGLLRLVNSSAVTPGDGRLEISYHGIWMSVCGLLFTQSAADVACRQLGFQPAANFCTDACYGKGTNEIHFGDYLCRGNESGLLECGINIHKTGSCNHEYDVGLSCSPLQSVPVAVATSSSIGTSSSPSPSLPTLTPSQVASTLHSPPNSNAVPRGSVTPPGENSFISDGIIYVLAVVLCLLLLALMISVTICCVFHKKRDTWVLQAQNGSYSDRNDRAIAHAGQTNGDVGIREVVGEGEGEGEGSEFDFDAVADSVEMKTCAKAAEAMQLSPDHTSLASGPPPQYHELEFLSHSLSTEEEKKGELD